MNEFHFLRPWWFLALIPALLLWWRLYRINHQKSDWQRVIEADLLKRLWLEAPGGVSRWPMALLGLGWLLAVVVLAGPVWERQPETVWRTQSARVLVLDLSASMNVADLAPSRLERARFKIRDMLQRSREGRMGLVVFAGEPHRVAPLTEDNATLANLLSALTTDMLPVEGDAGAPALQLAAELLQQAGVKGGDLLLLSDGIADPAAALNVVQALRAKGHRLSVMAVGTAQGAPLPGAAGGFQGMARLQQGPLQALARAGGGGYSVVTADDRDLNRLLLPPQQQHFKQDDAQNSVQRWLERGVWLMPLLLLLALAGFRRGWLATLLVVLVLPPPAQALEWGDLWRRPDQQAAQSLEEGRADEAAQRFQDPSWRGMALYQKGDYEAAAQAFAQAGGVEADYNRGNALAKAGQLQQAAEAYRQSLQQNPDHADAKANLALIEALLKQQQGPQQPQSSPQSGESGEQQTDGAQGQQPKSEQGQQSEEGKGEGDKPQPSQQGESQSSEKDAQQAESNRKQDQESGSQAEQDAAAPQKERESQDQARKDVEAQVAKPGSDKESETETATEPEAEQQQEVATLNEAEGDKKGQPDTQSRRLNEQEMAMEQWLRQIPEDPGGLLRRKFMLEHLRRKQE